MEMALIIVIGLWSYLRIQKEAGKASHDHQVIPEKYRQRNIIVFMPPLRGNFQKQGGLNE
jgi:hypothetical protein